METRACISFLLTVPWYLSYKFTVMSASSSSSLNSCPQMTFFTDLADASPTRPNLSYMDGATNSSPVFFKASLIHKVVCSPALWCKRRTYYTFCVSQSWYMLVWGLCRVAMYTWKLNFFPSPQISITIISLIYQKTDAITYPADRAVMHFSIDTIIKTDYILVIC